MKQTAIAALLLLLSAGFGLASMALGPQPPQAATEAAEDIRPVLTDLRAGDVQGFTIRCASGNLGVIPHGTQFEIVGDEMPYSRERLSAFLYAACHLTAERILVDPDPPEAYGLEPPVSQISLLRAGEEPLRIRIGDLCPVSDGRYASVEGSGRIALLPGDISELLAATPQDLQDLRLFPDFDVNGSARLDRLTLESGGESFTLARVADSVSGLFTMTAPVVCTPDWQAVNDRLLIPLAALTPSHFVSADAGAPARFGLDAPDTVLTLTIDGETRHCLLRTDPAGGLCYCYSPEQGRVCSLPASAVSFLSLSYADLLGGTVYRQSLAAVARIRITDGAGGEEILFSGTGETLSAHTGGTLLDAAQAARFFRQVTAIPLAGTLTDRAAPEASPVLTMTVNLRDGDADVLEFLPLASGYCAVSVNGVCQFATYSTVPALIRQCFEALR